MNTSVIGYPRIGEFRELKFAAEKFFRGEISKKELLLVGKELRIKNWLHQKSAGIDYIPSNDFSLYDAMLDTAYMLNVIPKRYHDLGLDEIDTYFAMARGFQNKGKDVKALPMQKWFNTNYHFIVPEFDDKTKINLSGTKMFDEFSEALELGIRTKPVIIGPLTFLKLSSFRGDWELDDFLPEIISAYSEIFSRFSEMGVDWIQVDEPILVTDLSEEDKTCFEKIYSVVLASKKGVHILLQTYFGDVRDVYQKIFELPFDGVGLDFVEGIKTKELVTTFGFPNDKILFAGVVNGKNIWRNNYKKTMQTVNDLRNTVKSIVLSTSCSLLHAPYTVENEKKLSEEITKHLAFAEEKLEELIEIGLLLDSKEYLKEPAFLRNQVIQTTRSGYRNQEVGDRVLQIKGSDYTRRNTFDERYIAQKNFFNLPILPTTTIGSFPQTTSVKSVRARCKKGEISDREYQDSVRQKIREWIGLQEELGLDVLVHGEFERNDMVEYFGENLYGFIFTGNAWVQSYGTRGVKPPIIWGDISRKGPITIEYSKYAQSLTTKPVKGMLTGPVTILNWSFPREDVSLSEVATQISLAIRDEVMDLEAADIQIIQIDEAALKEKLPLRKTDWQKEYLDWAIPTFRLVHSGVRKTTQIHTHMCYSEFSSIIKSIVQMDADVITFEASRSDFCILDALHDTSFPSAVGPGVYDIHSPRVPTIEEIEQSIDIILSKIDAPKVWINPDCGLKTRGEQETLLSLKNMVAATKRKRNEINAEIYHADNKI